MRLKQLAPLACATRAHCHSCRNDPEFRYSVTGVREFDCPHGITIDGDAISDPNPPKSRGLGDTFHDIVAKKYGIPACQKCMEVIAEMNAMGVAGCAENKDRIIGGIWDRRDQLKGWKSAISKMPGSETLARLELSRLFDRAIKEHLNKGRP